MKLHLNRELFIDAIKATSEFYGLREIFIEKDYWVTLTLKAIFKSDFSEKAVFKGGTSLAKCYKIIHRFSEDIDIAVTKEIEENDNQLKRRIRSISKLVGQMIPEIEINGLTNKMGNIRKTVHQYEKLYSGDFGQTRDKVVLEISSMGDFEPNIEMNINSYIYDMMLSKNMESLIEEYELEPFPGIVLSKERTLCEKIMSLVRFSKSGNPINDLKNKIRHFYDIHQLLTDSKIQGFFQSNSFNIMLLKVGSDDIIAYKNNNDWLIEHPAKALVFVEPGQLWQKIKSEYNTKFRDLVYKDFPPDIDILKSILLVSERIRQIEWNIFPET